MDALRSTCDPNRKDGLAAWGAARLRSAQKRALRKSPRKFSAGAFILSYRSVVAGSVSPNLGILALALVAVIVVGVAAGPSDDWGDDGGHHHPWARREGW